MKILVAGAGKIGHTVCRVLAEEGHDLTVIDLDPDTVSLVANDVDVITVEGNAADPELLREAGTQDADLFLAVTEKDETNMVCGAAAHHLGAKHVIARIRDPLYLHQKHFLREALGLSQIVNPEYECASEIARILRFPGASRVDTFAGGRVEIAEHRIPPSGALDGMSLRDLNQRFRAKVLIALVERDGEPLIPNGATVLEAGDRLSITGTAGELRRFFMAIGEYRRPVRRVMIMGGSTICIYLTRILQENGIDVTVIERDREVCDSLCDQIPKAHIVCGDATHSDVLQEDGIASADAFVALTGDDGDNIITSLYARSCEVGKVVTKVNREHFAEILEQSGLDSIVSPKDIVAEQLARYVRAIGNSAGSVVESLYRLVDGKVEVLEFLVQEDAACIGIPLKDLKLRPQILISAVIRKNKTLLPDGNTAIQPDDRIIVVTAAGRLSELDGILEEKP